MNVVRDANVILRFCILHSLSSHRAVSSAMSYMPSKEKIVDVLLDSPSWKTSSRRFIHLS